MSAYRYQACNADGREERGLIEADSPRAARAQLRERGLMPLAVDEVAAEADKVQRKRKLSGSALALLTRQLATLLTAGLPLERALSALIEQSEDPAARELMATVRSDILEGMSLSHALAQRPQAFTTVYRAMVAAGEQSGRLDQILLQLADYLDRRQSLQQKVLFALAYPAVVTVVAFGVVMALMTYVVPQVVDVFRQTHQSLPLLTRTLVAMSDFIRKAWLLLLAGTLAVVWGGWRALKVEAIRRRVDLRLLKLPLFGRLLRGVNSARMASTLAILVGSGVPLLTALDTARALVALKPMQDAIADASARVREGATLGGALAASGLFPPVLIHLIKSGEASGALPTMLARAAEEQERDVERRLTALTTLFEPVLILSMGVVVLVIVLAIMLPIVDMNQMVR